MELTKEELLAMESQLKCPEGEQGVEMGKTMHNSNIDMTIESINTIDIQEDEAILEIGHGNCKHLLELLKRANIKYNGLDISRTMHQEAKKINKKYIQRNQIKFDLYNGQDIPYRDNRFDKIFTVNTIYFWEKPTIFLKEIYRVLKNDGLLVITFAQKKFMKSLPFVMDKFKLFDNKEIKKIVNATSFKLIEIKEKAKNVKSKTGETVTRKFTIIKLKK